MLPVTGGRISSKLRRTPGIVCRKDGIVERINPRAAHRFELSAVASEGVYSILDLLPEPSNRKLARILQADRSDADTLYLVEVRGDGMPAALMGRGNHTAGP